MAHKAFPLCCGLIACLAASSPKFWTCARVSLSSECRVCCVLGGRHRDCIWYKESMVKTKIFFFAVDSKSFGKIRIQNLKSLGSFLANFQRSMQCIPQRCWDHANGRTLQKHVLLSLCCTARFSGHSPGSTCLSVVTENSCPPSEKLVGLL